MTTDDEDSGAQPPLHDERPERMERRVPRYVRAQWAHSETTPYVGAVERETLEADLLAEQDRVSELTSELSQLRAGMAEVKRTEPADYIRPLEMQRDIDAQVQAELRNENESLCAALAATSRTAEGLEQGGGLDLPRALVRAQVAGAEAARLRAELERHPVTDDLDREEAVQAIHAWLRRGAPTSSRPGADVLERLLSLAYGLEQELEDVRAQRDEGRSLARWLWRAGGAETMAASRAGVPEEWPWLEEES